MNNKNTVCISTGFKNLDAVLDGGLYSNFYVLGAISSLGKTTFIIQMADQMAYNGYDVLFFSLEMSRKEIIAKSISRHTLQLISTHSNSFCGARTAREIILGSQFKNYSETEKKIVDDAINSYSQYAKHLFINEGLGDTNIAQIKHTVEKHLSFTGKTPVVIIDYLQIIKPSITNFSDKQNMDNFVTELKKISKEYNTPVIAISSFNRANYKEPVTMEAFKESGAIEYLSDVLIGLQFNGISKKDFDLNRAKMENPRNIELVILKNRNGRSGDKIKYKYYAPYNYFKENNSV